MNADRSARVVAACGVMAKAIGWVCSTGTAAPVLGRGEGEPIATVHPHPQADGVFDRGLVVWGESEVLWAIDDGAGGISSGAVAGPAQLGPAVWPAVWALARDPVELVEAMLIAEGERIDRRLDRSLLQVMGAPVRGSYAVEWGVAEVRQWDREGIRIEVVPANGWPFVQCGNRKRFVRDSLSPLALARRLAGLAVDFVHRSIQTWPKLAEAFAPASRFVEVSRGWSVPDVPPDVATAATGRGGLVEDWQTELRRWLASEGADARASRLQRVDERRGALVFVPGKGIDDFGRPTRWSGEAMGPDRLPVPATVIGALWALGLSVRPIAEVTTGSAAAKSSVGRRLAVVQGGADGWDATTGGQLVERMGVQWALAEVVQRQTRRRPTEPAGGSRGTPARGRSAPAGRSLVDVLANEPAPAPRPVEPAVDAPRPFRVTRRAAAVPAPAAVVEAPRAVRVTRRPKTDDAPVAPASRRTGVDRSELLRSLDDAGVEWEEDATGDILVETAGDFAPLVVDPEAGTLHFAGEPIDVEIVGLIDALFHRRADLKATWEYERRHAPKQPLQGPVDPEARRRWLDFEAGLPADARRFLALVRSRGTVALGEAMDALTIDRPKAIGGITGPIGRWAPVKGVQVPYAATTVDGERAWTWIGGPETQP